MVMKIGVVSKESCLMQQVKLNVKLKTNPHILRRGGGIKMWIQLCVERESSLGFGNRVKNEEDRKKHCDTKKMLREQYIWLQIIVFSPKTLKYWVGVQQGESYLKAKRYLFSVGWQPFQ